MNYQEARKEWVKALRSGDYKQAVGFLGVKEDGVEKYCCLGVACEVYNKFNDEPLTKDACGTFTSVPFNINNDSCYYKYNEEKYELPKEVQKWLNIEEDGELIRESPPPNNFVSLVSMNDIGRQFSEIADVIEQNLVKDLS